MPRIARLLSTASLALAAMPLYAGEGLKLNPDSSLMPRWQVRLALAAPTVDTISHAWNTPTARGAARVTSDYYFFDRMDADGAPEGLRATGALLFGPRSVALGTPGPSGTGSVLVRASSWSGEAFDVAGGDASTTTPYVGVGYSAGWAKVGLNLSADLGLMGQRSGGVRLGRSFRGAELGEDALHDLRITPVLQLNLSYSF